MGLVQWCDRARQFLYTRPQPVTRTEIAALKIDRFQEALWKDVVKDVPPVRELIGDLNERYDYTDELVRDVGLSFWQTSPELRSTGEMDPTRLANHAVVSAMQNLPEYTDLRQYTQLDEYGAGMAAVAVTNSIKEELEKNKALAEAGKKAQKAQEKAESTGDECSTAIAMAEGAQAAAEAAEDLAAAEMHEGEGPLTEKAYESQLNAEKAGQMAKNALAALQKAVAAAEAATADSVLANGTVDEAAASAQRGMQTAIRQALKDAGQKLEEEAKLFETWGVDPGDLKKMNYNERALLARALRNNRISKYLQLVGRFKAMRVGMKTKKVEYARDEVYTTELSGDISRILGSEMAQLASSHRMLRLSFLARFNEGSLISRKYRGTEKVGHGSIICCVDTSGSMANPNPAREAWAKAFALALLDQAKASKRDFVAINFSNADQIGVHRFPIGKQKIADVMAFVEQFFNGGTSFESPLNTATDILEKEFNSGGKKNADIVFITDGQGPISPEWTMAYQARKKALGFRVFGIAIDCPVSDKLNSFCDNVRTIDDFTDPALVADIFQVIE